MDELGLQIRDRLGDYLAGVIDLREYRASFMIDAWNIDKRASEQTADLVHDIQLLLAEYEHGDWTEPEMRARLAEAAAFDIESSEVFTVTAGASTGTFLVETIATGAPVLRVIEADGPDARFADISL